MDNQERPIPDQQTLISEWMKMANQLWAKSGSGPAGPSSEEDAPPKKENARVLQDAFLSTIKSFTAISTALSEPSAVDAVFRGTATLPDITSNFLQSGMQAFLTLQHQAFEKVNSLNERSEPYSFDNLDQETLQSWSNIYKKEIRRYFNIPQLGLNRYHQERVNNALDKYNLFSSCLAEFLQLIQMPFEKTNKMMHEKIETLTKKGNLPADSREYYRMWVKTLEGHFMTLFQSSEYNETFSNTLAALEDYLGARNDIIQDMLQTYPIPTNKEMDDLYKEVYLLKKKVRKLEKANGKG